MATACDDGDPCTADACDPSGGCVYSPIEGSFACDDGNACTSRDACVNGACTGSAIPGCCGSDAGCDDGNACTVDTCISGVCSNSPVTCSSGDPCLVAFCDPASGSCSTAPRSCDDAVACTTDSCDPGLGCVHDPAPCSVCGDGVRNGAEECDGADLGGVDCTDFHDTPNTYYGGWYGLTCTRDCYWDISLCARCGNRVADNTTEQCDTDDLAGQTCQTLGFSDGTLTCHDDCSFDTSACTR